VRTFFAILVPTRCVTAIKLSLVGAGRARDDGTITLQSLCKYRGRGPLLRSVDVLNLMAVTRYVGMPCRTRCVLCLCYLVSQTLRALAA